MNKRIKHRENIYTTSIHDDNICIEFYYEYGELKKVSQFSKIGNRRQEWYLKGFDSCRYFKKDLRIMFLIFHKGDHLNLKIGDWNRISKLFYKHHHIKYHDKSLKNDYFYLLDGEKNWDELSPVSGYFLHRIDGPAFVSYNEEGEKEVEVYCKEGLVHRDGDLPAEIFYFETQDQEFEDNSEIQREVFYQNGKIHRDNNPAEIEYDPEDSEKPVVETYYQYGLEHNENGWSSRYKGASFIGNGQEVNCTYTEYWINGMRESIHDQPAVIIKSDEDNRISYEWYHEDQPHRIGGPAVIGNIELGGHIPNPRNEIYYLFGEEYSLKRYRQIIHSLRKLVRIWKNKKRTEMVKDLNQIPSLWIKDINSLIGKYLL